MANEIEGTIISSTITLETESRIYGEFSMVILDTNFVGTMTIERRRNTSDDWEVLETYAPENTYQRGDQIPGYYMRINVSAHTSGTLYVRLDNGESN